MSRSKTAEPAQLERWEVTWWQIDNGALVLHSRSFEMPGDARAAYATLHVTTEPKIIKHHWNLRAGRWESADVVGQAVTPERAADINARGFASVRALIAHARGHDSRGWLESLDEFLASNHADLTHEPLVGETAADCVVCDYLCQNGLAVDDCHVTVVEQSTLEYRDITEPETF